METLNFLKNALEEAIEKELTPAPETEPFKFKYESRLIYQSLLTSSELSLSESDLLDPKNLENDPKKVAIFMVSFFLANNYFDTEEYTLSSKTMIQTELTLNSILNKTILDPFNQYLLHFYTNFGFLKTQNEVPLGRFSNPSPAK